MHIERSFLYEDHGRIRKKMDAEGINFPKFVRKEIKKEHQHKCAICGGEHNLEIHHIVPKMHGGSGAKENGMAVCRKPCHMALDEFALKRIYFPEVIMEPGFWYKIEQFYEVEKACNKKQYVKRSKHHIRRSN